MDLTQRHTARATPRRDRTQVKPMEFASTLSLVLPAYNEEDTIRQAIREASAALEPITAA